MTIARVMFLNDDESASGTQDHLFRADFPRRGREGRSPRTKAEEGKTQT